MMSRDYLKAYPKEKFKLHKQELEEGDMYCNEEFRWRALGKVYITYEFHGGFWVEFQEKSPK